MTMTLLCAASTRKPTNGRTAPSSGLRCSCRKKRNSAAVIISFLPTPTCCAPLPSPRRTSCPAPKRGRTWWWPAIWATGIKSPSSCPMTATPAAGHTCPTTPGRSMWRGASTAARPRHSSGCATPSTTAPRPTWRMGSLPAGMTKASSTVWWRNSPGGSGSWTPATACRRMWTSLLPPICWCVRRADGSM